MPRKKRLRVCAVTSTRADWGLLRPLLKALQTDRDFDLRLIVTGQHMVKAAGDTRKAIKADGFDIDAAVDMKLAGDSAEAITASLGIGIGGIGKALSRLKPDLLFVLGDRYEILGAVTAAMLARIPVVHNWGGDTTEGAVDEYIRHAMTKMSHLHFPTNAASRTRIIRMGENPSHVVAVGSSGIEQLRTMKLLGRAAFFKSVGLTPRRKNAVITFHPETLAARTEADCAEMLAALDDLGPDVGLVFSGSNADMEGRAIDKLVHAFVKTHPNAVFHASLGSQRYLSAMKHCDAVIGNSSSGVYEAPSFQTPTVNIGDRQKGRLRARSVIDVRPTRSAIRKAILKAFAMDCRGMKNPYGDGHASGKMRKALRKILDGIDWDTSRLLRKAFHS